MALAPFDFVGGVFVFDEILFENHYWKLDVVSQLCQWWPYRAEPCHMCRVVRKPAFCICENKPRS